MAIPFVFCRLAALILVGLLVSNSNARGLGNHLPEADVPHLSLLTTAGETVSLADFRGNVVLVNFWASWCGPCVTEIPDLRSLSQEMAGKPFVILAVNVKEGRFKVHNFTKLVSMPFPVLLDSKGEIFDRWGAEVLPTSYLLSPTGEIRYRVEGPVEWTSTEVVDTIDSLLSEMPAM